MDQVLFQAQNEIFTITVVREKGGGYRMRQTKNDGSGDTFYSSFSFEQENIELMVRNLKFAYKLCGYRVIFDGSIN